MLPNLVEKYYFVNIFFSQNTLKGGKKQSFSLQI